MTGFRAVLAAGGLLAAAILAACSEGDSPVPPSESNPPHKETPPMSGLPSFSRLPAPQVPPVELKGVRYEQEMQGLRRGLDQPTGYLVAFDVASGEKLWELKVYPVKTVEGLETDVQRIYFRSMKPVPGRDELLIENEVGGRYRVDLVKRTVAPAE